MGGEVLAKTEVRQVVPFAGLRLDDISQIPHKFVEVETRLANVRFGSEPDVPDAAGHVRFEVESGHSMIRSVRSGLSQERTFNLAPNRTRKSVGARVHWRFGNE